MNKLDNICNYYLNEEVDKGVVEKIKDETLTNIFKCRGDFIDELRKKLRIMVRESSIMLNDPSELSNSQYSPNDQGTNNTRQISTQNMVSGQGNGINTSNQTEIGRRRNSI